MTENRPVVALLGLGLMGDGMARNLLKAGLDLRVWNRTADKAAAVGEAGARVAADPAEAVRGADLVVTMLWDADSVADVMRQAAPGLGAESVWLQMTTVGVAGIERLTALAAELGVAIVDAPVLGTRQPAADGTLVVLASGPDGLRDRCAPVFDAVGAKTVWVGPVGAGSRLKLVANNWVLAVIEGVAESISLAQALGLDPADFFGAIAGGAMDAPYVHVKGRAMVDGSYDTSFTLDGAAKDADLILDAARGAGVRLPGTEATRDLLADASAAGHGDKDMAAIFLARRQIGS